MLSALIPPDGTSIPIKRAPCCGASFPAGHKSDLIRTIRWKRHAGNFSRKWRQPHQWRRAEGSAWATAGPDPPAQEAACAVTTSRHRLRTTSIQSLETTAGAMWGPCHGNRRFRCAPRSAAAWCGTGGSPGGEATPWAADSRLSEGAGRAAPAAPAGNGGRRLPNGSAYMTCKA